jgi:hypothetical protein
MKSRLSSKDVATEPAREHRFAIGQIMCCCQQHRIEQNIIFISPTGSSDRGSII